MPQCPSPLARMALAGNTGRIHFPAGGHPYPCRGAKRDELPEAARHIPACNLYEERMLSLSSV
jgi:hypothetical protein